DALERFDEVFQVRAVMGVDDADAAIFVDVVTAEQQIAHLEAELTFRVAGRVPDLQPQVADGDGVAFIEEYIDLARWQRNIETLRRDGGEGDDLVAAFERIDAERMS